MHQNLIASIALLAPLLFIITAVASWFYPGIRPKPLKTLSKIAIVTSIIVAAICSYFVIQYNLLETTFIGIYDIGFSLRLDSLSIMMLAMISLLGFIVVRYSFNYLDGDQRQGIFLGRLAATIASVQLLVLSGNTGILLISWICTSMSLHRLLIFYKERPGALIAARKKFILARLGDVCLILIVVLLYQQFGTGNLELIFQEVKNGINTASGKTTVETVAFLLVAAAVLKSAQFPTHGWLVEVMETPTPVSALLHAGLLNAGPFLVIRMAFIMDASTYTPFFLLIIGAITAIFASVVFLTQTSIKTALGYSSVAHMGFSLFVCGLGLYPAAMLHLVAHSFYKAHSFLASGSVIDVIKASKVTAAKRKGSAFRILLGILLAVAVYSVFAFIWGIDPVEEFSLFVIGGIIVLGLSRLFTSAIDSDGSLQLIFRASIISLLVTTAFFTLELGMHILLSTQMPELAAPGFGTVVLVSILFVVFSTIVFLQIFSPSIKETPIYRTLAVHLRNGLYMNTLFDRLVRASHIHGSHNQVPIIDSIDPIENQSTAKPKASKKQTV